MITIQQLDSNGEVQQQWEYETLAEFEKDWREGMKKEEKANG